MSQVCLCAAALLYLPPALVVIEALHFRALKIIGAEPLYADLGFELSFDCVR